MENDDFSDAAILGRVLPTRPDRPAAAPMRQFKPWHRPRKQWVRRFQWYAEALTLLRETHFPADARTFRYLSMPGEDLLDVRILREACEAENVEMRFTGLNFVKQGSPDDLLLNLSENAVRGLDSIHPGSKILRERFQSIAERDSLAHTEVRDSGPFNAINIDLCDHIALREQNAGRPTVIDALAEIVQGQLQHAIHPWLLFITTRIAPAQVDPNNLSAFVRAIQHNIAESDEFSRRVEVLLREQGDDLSMALANPDALDPARFKDLFCLGFGKWLLAYINAAVPARSLHMLPGCYYSVHAGAPDMLSLAFRCNVVRRPPVDAFDIIRVQHEAPLDNEVGLALELVDATRELFDLDGKLAADAGLMERVTEETEALLRAAHYPVDDAGLGYRAWVNGRPAAA